MPVILAGIFMYDKACFDSFLNCALKIYLCAKLRCYVDEQYIRNHR